MKVLRISTLKSIGLCFILFSWNDLLASSLSVGQDVPWFAGWTSSGQVINQQKIIEKNYRNNVLFFVASWCSGCKVCLEKVKDYIEPCKHLKAGFFAIDYMEDAATAKKYLNPYGFADDGIIIDQFGSISESFGIQKTNAKGQEASLPLVVVFGPDKKALFTSSDCTEKSFLKRLLLKYNNPERCVK